MVGGTGGPLVYNAYYGAANSIPADTLIGTLGPLGPGAYSASGPTAGVSGDAPFSLTQEIIITHLRADSTSFDAELNMVPEPSALLLFGSGLAALGFLRLRKRS